MRLRDFPLVTPRKRVFVCALVISALSTSIPGASAQTDPSAAAGSTTTAVPVVPADGAVPVASGSGGEVPITPLASTPTSSAKATTTTTIAPKRTLVISGRGFGHGRGLGQWGAYGYATMLGWTSRQILDHYYGGTVPGGIAPTSAIGVRIANLDVKPLALFQPKGRLYLRLDNNPGLIVPPALSGTAVETSTTQPAIIGAAATVPTAGATTTTTVIPSAGAVLDPPLATGAGAAVRIRLVKGAWEVSDAPTCAGPWTVRTAIPSRTITVTTGPLDTAASPDDPDTMLHLCEGKQRRVYRGDFLAITDGKVQRGVNLVGMEAYLRGVVPREISASWGDKGIEAVKAQAVAARSYAAAEKRSGFSNTCDTIACQVYGGRGIVDGKGFTSLEDPRTDRAVAETAGEIRVNPKTGVAIRTEFSASTGGFTAGGEFPAVADEGDAIPANPNRSWERRIAGSEIANGRKLGALKDVVVTARDGNGPDGGRVVKVQLVFEKGAATVSGNDFMKAYGLKSTLFTTQVLTDGASAAAVAPVTDTAPGQALTGDAGGPVLAAGALPDGALGTASSTVKPSVPPSTKKKAAIQKLRRNPNTTIVMVKVALGASPIKTVPGGAVVGSPTTAPKKAASKKPKSKKAVTKSSKKSVRKTWPG